MSAKMTTFCFSTMVRFANIFT